MNPDLICVLAAAIVYGGAFLLAARHVQRTIPTAEKEREDKGYICKRDESSPTPSKPTTTEYHYDNVSVMSAPPSEPPSSSGSDPPPTA